MSPRYQLTPEGAIRFCDRPPLNTTLARVPDHSYEAAGELVRLANERAAQLDAPEAPDANAAPFYYVNPLGQIVNASAGHGGAIVAHTTPGPVAAEIVRLANLGAALEARKAEDDAAAAAEPPPTWRLVQRNGQAMAADAATGSVIAESVGNPGPLEFMIASANHNRATHAAHLDELEKLHDQIRTLAGDRYELKKKLAAVAEAVRALESDR